MLDSPLNPSEKRHFYRALYALSIERDSSFDIIRQHFKSEARRLEEKSRMLKDETEFRWAQGALQVLGDLEEMIMSARSVLEKLDS